MGNVEYLQSEVLRKTLLYCTTQWLENNDKCRSKPEVYWKCNIWQIDYAIPV